MKYLLFTFRCETANEVGRSLKGTESSFLPCALAIDEKAFRSEHPHAAMGNKTTLIRYAERASTFFRETNSASKVSSFAMLRRGEMNNSLPERYVSGHDLSTQYPV
jgi:hypothetical protein